MRWSFFMQSKCIWLDVEEETYASINRMGSYNFKPYRGHSFMTATKIYQFCDSPTPLNPQKLIQFLLFKNKKNLQTHDKFQDSRHPLPFHVDVINVRSLKCLLQYFFSVLEKNAIMLLEQKKPIILLKDTSKP